MTRKQMPNRPTQPWQKSLAYFLSTDEVIEYLGLDVVENKQHLLIWEFISLQMEEVIFLEGVYILNSLYNQLKNTDKEERDEIEEITFKHLHKYFAKAIVPFIITEHKLNLNIHNTENL